MNKNVKIKLWGDLGDTIGKEWSLNVQSVSEALRAIEVLSNNRLYKYLAEKDKGCSPYKILINNKLFKEADKLDINNPESIVYSELNIKNGSLQSIDIVPIIQGSDGDIFSAILGALLIIVGVVLIATGVGGVLGAALVIGGIGLLAAGIINLLSSPPKFADFREIDGATGRTSYLFNGPTNTTREGGPIPIGYGRLLVGSQTISASYKISYIDAGIPPTKVTDSDGQPYTVDENGNRVYSDVHGAYFYDEAKATSTGVPQFFDYDPQDTAKASPLYFKFYFNNHSPNGRLQWRVYYKYTFITPAPAPTLAQGSSANGTVASDYSFNFKDATRRDQIAFYRKPVLFPNAQTQKSYWVIDQGRNGIIRYSYNLQGKLIQLDDATL